MIWPTDISTATSRVLVSLEIKEGLGRKAEIVTNRPGHMRPAFRKSIEQDEVRIYEST